jgi:hypothetical protein
MSGLTIEEDSIVKKYYLLICLILVGPSCAGKIIRVDMDTFKEHQAFFEEKSVLITTELKAVKEEYSLLEGNYIELTAPVAYFGDRKFRTWYLLLEKDGETLRCYESKYRLYPERNAVFLLRKARHEGGEITVRGKLYYDGIELNYLIYKNYIVTTNYRAKRL